MFIILTDKVSQRLKYALEEIFVHRLKKPYILTEDKTTFGSHANHIKIQYTSVFLEELGGFWIENKGFLEQEYIDYNFKPELVRYQIVKNQILLNHVGFISRKFPDNPILKTLFIEKYPAYFPNKGMLTFDIFSMFFWNLSRYEEYQNYIPDKHGRFTYSQSLDSKNGIHSVPYLDLALIYFASLLNIDLCSLWHIENKPTVDIDIAYKYLGRGLFRTLFSAIKHPRFLQKRIKVFLTRDDPYAWNNTISKKLNPSKSIRIFWLCSSKTNYYNKQVSLDYKRFIIDIKNSSNNFTIGLHPSANTSKSKWTAEKIWLQKITNQDIHSSRQHFLLLTLPETYNDLISIGIKEDWSMGYSDDIGFRAATSYSFRWFDLKNNTSTPFVIHPFCFMDVTLKNYLQLKSDEALAEINKLYDWISLCGGMFCYILHNESLSSDSEWNSWQPIFEQIINRE